MIKLKTEIKVVGYDIFWMIPIFFILFTVVMILGPGLNEQTMNILGEMVLTIIIGILISYTINLKDDNALEIILSCPTSLFKLIFKRYSILVSYVLMMQFLYAFIISSFIAELNILIYTVTFLPNLIFFGSLSVGFTILFKSGIISGILTTLYWLFNLVFQKVLTSNFVFKMIYPFYKSFNIEDQLFYLNKLTLLLITVLIWILIALVIKINRTSWI